MAGGVAQKFAMTWQEGLTSWKYLDMSGISLGLRMSWVSNFNGSGMQNCSCPLKLTESSASSYCVWFVWVSGVDPQPIAISDPVTN